ncbi:hypothetical protein ABE10_11440 [Bacillus toyonensis]|nr:hypothetical protein [Bacillus toyonensis]
MATKTTDRRVAYSPTETAKLLGVSRGFVYRELREGTIPSTRLGDRILVPAEWIESFARESAA